MFEIRLDRIRGSCEELHDICGSLNRKEPVLEELLADMKGNELFEDTRQRLSRQAAELEENINALYGLTEALYTIDNRYRRCEESNTQEAEGCATVIRTRGITRHTVEMPVYEDARIVLL
ncbi:MAG: hypothetical protein IKI75_12175 [Lachnospiraceae bacterium]|nr:hypothetical protein [Lachnospiraceae bacterium]